MGLNVVFFVVCLCIIALIIKLYQKYMITELLENSTDRANKIRMDWMKSFKLYAVWNGVLFAIILLRLLTNEIPEEEMFETNLMLLTLPLQLWACHHFAYNKEGTKWLAFWVVGHAIYFGVGGLIALFSIFYIGIVAPFIWIGLLVLCYPAINFWYHSRRLWFLNRDKKEHKDLSVAP